MKIPNPRLSVLGLLCAFHVVGIYLFTTGFFLARHELPTVSTCEEQDPGVGCWTSGTYDRAIVVIIDALRFDFAYFNKTKLSEKEQREGGSRFFRNKLGVIHDLIEKEPSKARLFKFIADPPTVTMQRLKGMTTGSLPTFLDIKDNFASEAVEEDNIVHQLARHGKKVVMMGDDTWVNLFPESFAEKYPYPSFNVKDLHTVDNGVLEHLMPTIHGGSDARTQGRTDGKGHDADWDVLIAHFLGVDHVGHRYGPEHEWMTRKLTQMDAVLGHIIKAVDPSAPISPHPIPEYGKKGGHREGKGGSVDEDVKGEDTGEPEAGSDLKTLVLVLGDHGMTHDGNHGGASDDETQAGLFVYSSVPVFSADTVVPSRAAFSRQRLHSGEECVTIPQIDLVPTLSLLLGVPVPFGNLGTIVPELLMASEPGLVGAASRIARLRHLVRALRLNAQQVMTYFAAYSQVSDAFPHTATAQLRAQLERASETYAALFPPATPDPETKERRPSSEEADREQQEEDEMQLRVLAAEYQTILQEAIQMCQYEWTQFKTGLMHMGTTLVLLSAVAQLLISFYDLDVWLHACVRGSLRGLVLGGLATVFTDDSVAPVYLIMYVACTSALLHALLSGATGFSKATLAKLFSVFCELPRHPVAIGATVCFVAYAQGLFSNSFIIAEHAVVVFLGASVWLLCVLRQVDVVDGSASQRVPLAVPLLCIGLMCRALGDGQGFKPDGVLTGASEHASGTQVLDVFDRFCACASLLLLPALLMRTLSRVASAVPPRHHIGTMVVVLLQTLAICLYWAQVGLSWGPAWFNLFPRFVYLTSLAGLVLVVRLRSTAPDPHSRATCWLYRTVSTLGIVSGPLMLLLGPRAPALLLTFAGLLYCVACGPLCPGAALDSKEKGVQTRSGTKAALTVLRQNPNISLPEIIFYFFLVVSMFFATGHKNEFSSIPASCVFVGFEEFHIHLGKVFLVLNVFSGHILCLLGLPLIAATRALPPTASSIKTLTVIPSPDVLFHPLSLLLGLFTLRLALTMINATLQRRHLMVWAIFAPKYVFDGIALLCLDPLAIFVVYALSY